ncbi:MAG: class I adenylate-forming enzyme family protein [Hyphomicrobiales bacterium]
MILGETGILAATTLDEVFRRAAARRPYSIALTDPPNRESFTDGQPRRLTFAQADRAIDAIALRLRRLGLPSDAVVGIHLPNTVESVLTVLGVLRAGMIAVPLPLLWRRADITAALSPLGAKALITAARIGDFAAAASAVQVAADLFPIRHVCSFGKELPDGVIALDGLLDGEPPEPMPETVHYGNPAAHVALLTFDVTPNGVIPVARNHAELIAGGIAVLLEGGIVADARLLACCGLSSFAGMALTVVPWLLSGGTLSLHHGFDADAFADQNSNNPDTVIVPGTLVPQLADAGLLAHPALRSVLAAWRAPERCAASPAWGHSSASLTDVLIFGETALIGSRRDAHGMPVPLPAGTAQMPRGTAQAVPVADIARGEAGTLTVRGPMVPRHAFPTGTAELKADAQGYVDTFYPCRIDRLANTVTLTGPPPGIVSVGGYRFVLNELEDAVRHAGGGAFVTALPDALMGHRLAGISGGSDDVPAALTEQGANPLIADAFRAAASR